MQENKKSAELSGKELANTGFEKIAKDILNKEKVTEAEIEFIFKLDECFEIVELTVSASETRQTRPYESKNYFASVKYDISGALSILKARVASLPASERWNAYVEYRKALLSMLESKYTVIENKLRELMTKQQAQDGLSVNG